MKDYIIKLPEQSIKGEYTIIDLIDKYPDNIKKILLKNVDYIYYFLNQVNYKCDRKKIINIELSALYIRAFFPDNYKILEKFVKDDLLTRVRKHLTKVRATTYRVITRFNYLQPTISLFYSKDQIYKIRKRKNTNTWLSKFIIKKMNELILDVKLENIEISGMSYKQVEHIVNMYNDFNNKDWFIKECEYDRGGRLFCTINQMNKEILRVNIKHISGKKLIDIDMKNSQIWFMVQLMKKHFPITEYGEYYDFVKLVETGEIYDFFIKNYDGKITKDKVKKILFETIFKVWDYTEEENRKVRNLFKEFPEVWKMIEFLRFEYVNLAIKLQQMESDFFIQILSKELYNKRKFFIPIHDSVVILEDDENYVMDIINNYFNKEYNVIPKFN